RFSKLDYGDYELRFKKLDGFGGNNFSERKIFLIKPPYFYQTGAFYFLIGCFMIIVLFFYIRVSTARVRSRNRILELKIHDRTKNLKSALKHLRISQNNLKRQIRIQEYLLGAMSHDVVTPLKYLLLTIEKFQNGRKQWSAE